MSLFDHLWQSTLVAALVWLLSLMLRGNSATIRYRLWLAASLKFLLPFSLLAMLGAKTFVQPVPAASMAVLVKMRPVAVPFSAASPAEHLPWLNILAAIWLLGAFAVAAVWLVRWFRLTAIARAGRALAFDLPVPVRSTPLLMEPGLVGIWRPVILLPDGIEGELSQSEINAILRHELCHLARRDNLWAALHMLVEAVFWFHPLVWLIGARLVEEREAACDESVLAAGQNPLEYAEAILRVCRLYLRSPLACASGVAGADLGRRVDAIMARRDPDDLDPARKFLLIGLLLVSLAAPFAAGGLKSAPPVRLMQKFATSLLPALPATPPTEVKPAVRARHLQRHKAIHGPAADIPVRTVEEPKLSPAPWLILVDVPQLQASPQEDAGQTIVCRAPQRLPDSRLMGPKACLPQSEWDRLRRQNLVLMPDGKTLSDSYEKKRSEAARTCVLPSGGASNVASAGYCF